VLIVFLGPRGVGKSTQINKMSKQLKAKGVKVKITHLKTGIILGHFAATLLSMMLLGKRPNQSPLMALVEERPSFITKTFRLWLSLDLFVASIKFLMEVYIPQKMMYTVLTEDSIPSIVNDYFYLAKLTNTSLRKMRLEMRFFYKLMQICNVYIIFLDAEPKVLKDRRIQRGGDFEKRSDYLMAQRFSLKRVSENLVSKNRFLYINTSENNITDVYNKIGFFLSADI
jgi:thymidylate kinase